MKSAKLKKYLIGNWKANKTLKQAKIWIDTVKAKNLKIRSDLEIVLCPSFIHLFLFKNEYPRQKLGCQDISPFSDGAYTGEVTARMVADLVSYVILGHSERHRYFSEKETYVALKAEQALDNLITPIIAVHKDNYKKQLRALDSSSIEKSIIMYEPPEAISEPVGPIGKGEPAPLEEIYEMITEIKKEANPRAVIYGGSVKSVNLHTFLKEDIIDGVLPGSASLNAEEWISMLKIAYQMV